MTSAASEERLNTSPFQVADEGGALTLGGISQCPSYLSGMSKADVQKEFKKQIDVFVSEGMDFLLCEVGIKILLY